MSTLSAETALPAPSLALLRRLLGWPWWAQILVLFITTRVVTTAILLIAAHYQWANSWTEAQPGYFDFATIWDGHWYYIIAMTGYPETLPLDINGNITQNAWAFMPVYPFVVRGLMLLSGLTWPVASVIITLLCSLGASLVLYQLLRLKVGHRRTIWAVLLFLVAPLSPILQVSYAESMQLLLLFSALYLVLRRRYIVLLPIVLVMSFVRPTGLAFALFLGLHFIMRWVRHRTEPFPPREWASLILTGLLSALAGFGWFLIAAAVTGQWNAYTETELAWREPYIGRVELVPFSAWFDGANWWLRYLFQVPGDLWIFAAIVVLGLIALILVILHSAPARELGDEMRLWSFSYVIYLLAVFFPQSSTFRLLMPMAPLVGAVPVPRRRVVRVIIIAACIAGQGLWVWQCWWVGYNDWSPP